MSGKALVIFQREGGRVELWLGDADQIRQRSEAVDDGRVDPRTGRSEPLGTFHPSSEVTVCFTGPIHRESRTDALIRANAIAQVAGAPSREAALEAALIMHRMNLHSWTRQPCLTCQASAAALGISELVPLTCASPVHDLEALRSLGIEVDR